MTAYPFPVPVAVPEHFPTCETLCSWCDGTGQHEGVTASGDLALFDCEDCNASGVISEPDIPLCEACETKPQATEGLCKNCIKEAAENYAHELNVLDAEAELHWAQSVGWLPC